ncbi:hypothetical protein F511_21149 [Dorcoceras hygrometricum]|uniref:Uncharacterized protein n=1 Tax=Dorcoceras hygrometricum TaxID=472368 RepID=A0A2Z7A8L1_9LAMI|nr:hypothetical protein F511_21149 [Dorcoceras hygrometricum]
MILKVHFVVWCFRFCENNGWIICNGDQMYRVKERRISNTSFYVNVQNRVEQCLQLYMDKNEVISALIIHDNVEPRLTELVWQMLEEENHEFFKAYYLKLLVKNQIIEFNRLLSEQVELMHQIGFSEIAPLLASNGTPVSPTQYNRPLTTNDMQQKVVFHNCGAPIQPCLEVTFNAFGQRRKFDVTTNAFMSQNSSMVLAPPMNGKIVKTEAGYMGSSPFDPPSKFLESRPLMCDGSVSSFSPVETNEQHLNGTVLDGDASPYGLLNQISQTFGLPELATDFNTNSGLSLAQHTPPPR